MKISAVMPTLNSLAFFEGETERLRIAVDQVDEVILVDSDSTDGTVELLEAHIPADKLRVFRQPKGLYQAWNFGISQVTSPYLTLFTSGDWIRAGALTEMVAHAETCEVDVLVSVPEMISEGTKTPDTSWPVHELFKRHPDEHVIVLEGKELELFSMLYCRFRGNDSPCSSWLGSSAGNLYRTEVLQARPFPEDCGHAGDAIWSLEHASALRVGFVNERYSQFRCHEAQRSTPADARLSRLEAFSRPRYEDWANEIQERVLGCSQNPLFAVFEKEIEELVVDAFRADLISGLRADKRRLNAEMAKVFAALEEQRMLHEAAHAATLREMKKKEALRSELNRWKATVNSAERGAAEL